MDNVIFNIGDSLLIRINPKITGRVKFTGYVEDIYGLTTTRTVERRYRISTDNIFWSDWQELNADNIKNEVLITENSLYIEIEYTRTGTDDTGYVRFNNIVFNGTHEEIEIVAPTLMSSIFSKLVGTDELQSLEQNVFKKLYYRGIVPNYITRGDNKSYTEDKDYIDFFYSVARFFSLIIRFFKRWETMSSDEEMLREQIRGYNIYFDESNITLSELQYIAGNMLSIIQQRGTEMIFVRKGDKLPNGKMAEIDGEAVRLIRSRVCDELVYDSIPKYKMGWCMRNTSPLYRGTSYAYNLNKAPNITNKEVQDNGYLSGDKIVFNDEEIEIVATNSGGIGCNIKEDYFIAADSQMDYEVTFAFKRVTANGKLTFGIRGYDILKHELNDAFIHQDYRRTDNTFFELELDKIQSDTWYYVKGIIHAYNTEVSTNDKTNMGIGQDLVFNNYFLKYIYPQISIENGDIYIKDYGIRPLVRGKNIRPLKNGSTDSVSLGFIQAYPFFYTYFRNNNNSQSVSDITDIMERYLYPFNTINLFTVLNNS
jgi:hypothetical protein